MNSIKPIASSLASLLLTAAASAQHNHITVDTMSGDPFNQAAIRAGYLPAESDYTIVDHHLYHGKELAAYSAGKQLEQQGAFEGWYAGDGLSLTSDFFFATGRLDGGNFQFELAAVEVVSGAQKPATFAWGVFGLNGFNALARSDADERLARSFEVGVGGHRHGQGFAASEHGVYDLTFIVWDSNKAFMDSEPLTARFVIGPVCEADFDQDGFVNSQDFFGFLTAFFALDHDADFNHDESVNSQDLFDYLAAFFEGCA